MNKEGHQKTKSMFRITCVLCSVRVGFSKSGSSTAPLFAARDQIKKLKEHVITYCHRKKMKGYVMGESYCCMESSSCSTSNRKCFAWRTVNKKTHGTNYSISAKQILNCNHPLELGILLAIFCLWHKLRAPANIILLKEFILFGSLMQEKQFHHCERLLSSGATCTSPHVGRQRAWPPSWVLQGFGKRAGCVTENASVPALRK